MLLRLKIGLALALALGALLTVGGCAKKAVKTQSAQKSPDTITVAGIIKWQGDLQEKKIELIMDPVPLSEDGPGRIFRYFTAPPSPALPPEKLTEMMTATSFHTKLSTKGGVKYVIKITPPLGWKATPSEYKISKDISNADFTLEKIAK